MTKETKIGLLVGLAFIILFAIILSEKGTGPSSSTTPQFTKQSDPATTPGAAGRGETALANAGRLPVESALPETVPLVRGETTGRSARRPPRSAGRNEVERSKSDAASRGTSTGAVDLPRLPDMDDRRNEPAVAALPAERAEATPAPSEPAIISVPAERRDDEPTPTGRIEDALAAAARIARGDTLREGVSSDTDTQKTSPAQTTGARLGGESNDTIAAAAPADGHHATVKQEYTIQPGDSLSRIASQFYGTSSKTAVEQIYRANSERLKSPDSIRVGQTITIPVTQDRATGMVSESRTAGLPESMFEPVSSLTPVIPRPVDRETTGQTKPTENRIPDTMAKHRTYQVRARDTLIRIAREQLGDERGYKEIFELNRDVMANENSLRPGMKLKLPASSPRSERGASTGTRSSRTGKKLDLARR